MARLLLIICFVFTFSFGRAIEPNIEDTIVSSGEGIKSLLLSGEHTKRAKLINHLNHSGFFSQLESFSTEYKLDSIVLKNWSEESQSIENSFRYNYYLENEGHNVNVKIYAWNREENGWRISDEIYYDFNEEGFIIHAEFQKYVTHLYKTYTQINYSYLNKVLSEEVFSERLFDTDPWIKKEQVTYEYDSTGLLSTIIMKEWEEYDADWIVKSKTEYQYDTLANLVLETEAEYDSYLFFWEPNYKVRYIYDETNSLIQTIDSIPGWVEDTFIQNKKLETSYNAEFLLTHQISYQWDYDLNNWLPIESIQYSVGEEDKLFEEKIEVWNVSTNSWLNSVRKDYLSEENFSKEDIVYWEFIDIHFPLYIFDNRVCDKINSYAWIESQWIKSGSTTYHFTPNFPVSIEQLTQQVVKIYPNPVSDFVTIEIDNLAETECLIRDVNGKIVLQSSLFMQMKIDLSYLNTGVYFTELRQKGSRIFTGKIIKR